MYIPVVQVFIPGDKIPRTHTPNTILILSTLENNINKYIT